MASSPRSTRTVSAGSSTATCILLRSLSAGRHANTSRTKSCTFTSSVCKFTLSASSFAVSSNRMHSSFKRTASSSISVTRSRCESLKPPNSSRPELAVWTAVSGVLNSCASASITAARNCSPLLAVSALSSFSNDWSRSIAIAASDASASTTRGLSLPRTTSAPTGPGPATRIRSEVRVCGSSSPPSRR